VIEVNRKQGREEPLAWWAAMMILSAASAAFGLFVSRL
jgi:hypothetical protein